MKVMDAIVKELSQEAATTRRLLERVPEEHFNWKPHQKSMSMQELASHVAHLVSWTGPALDLDVFQMGVADSKPWRGDSKQALLDHFDEQVEMAREKMSGYPDEKLAEIWTLRTPDDKEFSFPRAVVVRSFILNHLVHHRGQLSVYLRLRDVPVPSIYGPSADDPGPSA